MQPFDNIGPECCADEDTLSFEVLTKIQNSDIKVLNAVLIIILLLLYILDTF